MSLLYYRILSKNAFNHASTWYNGNYAKILCKDAKIKSQDISLFLKKLGSEKLHQRFFEKYMNEYTSDNGIIIDSTELPNEIDFPLCGCGHHNGGIEKETRV
ncbi:MAG: hypothetical protein LBF68_05525 [Christensenellaceae bacterium]|jgi:hypothetical protein|nr:hypothetical protein [Christensenellaceae bacterium]